MVSNHPASRVSQQVLMDVGALYVVYSQEFRTCPSCPSSNPKSGRANLIRFLKEAAASARRMRELNPGLQVALATTEMPLEPRVASAFQHLVRLDAVLTTEPLWFPRLRAFAASPFQLTLAMDSHASACERGQHILFHLRACLCIAPCCRGGLFCIHFLPRMR